MKTIITDPYFDYLGKQIAEDNEGKIVKGDMDFGRFADKSPHLFAHRVKETIEHNEVTYLADFSNTRDLFVHYSAISGILDYYADKVRIIMPYFPVGTMERIDTKGQIATAKYFADIMSSFPSGRTGKTSIHIFDIHALQERSYFDNKAVNVEMHTAMNLLKDEIIGKTIVFPDDGAKKRFGNDFPDNEKLIFSKQRDGDKRKLHLQEGSAAGKDILIVDDLIQSGGTIKEATTILKSLGAKSVKAFATHGVFPKKSYKSLAKVVEQLIVTDSIPENVKRVEKIPNMKVLSLKSDIEKLIFNE